MRQFLNSAARDAPLHRCTAVLLWMRFKVRGGLRQQASLSSSLPRTETAAFEVRLQASALHRHQSDSRSTCPGRSPKKAAATLHRALILYSPCLYGLAGSSETRPDTGVKRARSAVASRIAAHDPARSKTETGRPRRPRGSDPRHTGSFTAAARALETRQLRRACRIGARGSRSSPAPSPL